MAGIIKSHYHGWDYKITLPWMGLQTHTAMARIIKSHCHGWDCKLTLPWLAIYVVVKDTDLVFNFCQTE